MTCPPPPAIAAAVRAAVLAEFLHDSCIASARATIEVLAYYGVRARPLAVKVGAWTALAWELLQAGTLDPGSLPPGAYATGIAGEGRHPPGGWDGHLVAVTSTHLYDPSLDQLARPDKGLVVTAAAFELPAVWHHGERVRVVLGDGTVIEYVHLCDDGWRRSPNWSRHSPHLRRVTGKAIRALQTHELETTP